MYQFSVNAPMPAGTKAPPVVYRSPFALGQTVYVGEDDATKAIVTGILWKEEAPQIELSWMHNGTFMSTWVSSRLVRPADPDASKTRPLEITPAHIEDVLSSIRGGTATRDTAELMEFIADRLVEVHGEKPNVDYILALRERAEFLRQAAKDCRSILVATKKTEVA
ncbi:hypothetical protein LPC10_01920 [Methylorubrum sp. B1-46]|uniref:hypothetical protein n=1 Tax=Methylorubrum sp. B1-46 TaxID=2897334 RepID=UPI001E28363B|nr:hypothetical protein [Methylorubrum sp. B1-46]UGB26398.1 hypothetical protein LPC10_01920 [Methylorubrum sp. B1-46]